MLMCIIECNRIQSCSVAIFTANAQTCVIYSMASTIDICLFELSLTKEAGPTFGITFAEFSVSDWSNMNNNSNSNFANNYQSPRGHSINSTSNYLTGCFRVNETFCYFSTVEIEVYQLVNKSLANY